MKEAIPSLNRLGTIFNAANPIVKMDLQALGATAKALGVELQPLAVQGPEEFERVFSTIASDGIQGISLIHDAVLTANMQALASLALERKVPSIGEGPYVKAGGLIGYGPDFHDQWRHAASYVDKILKGMHPRDLPVQLPTKFEFLINLKTAKTLDIPIPPMLLARADQLID